MIIAILDCYPNLFSYLYDGSIYKVPAIYLHEISNIAQLDLRRRMHLLRYLYTQKSNHTIVNTRSVFISCLLEHMMLYLS